jgi:hypothetical protein
MWKEEQVTTCFRVLSLNSYRNREENNENCSPDSHFPVKRLELRTFSMHIRRK